MGLKFKTGDPLRDEILFKIANLKYKELQAECLIRGLTPEEAVNWDAPKLSNWLLKNWGTKKDKRQLKFFDNWMDKLLRKKGIKKKDPIRRFKKFYDQYDDREEKPKVPKPPKIKKPPREKNEYGIFKGTKKEYTYRLAKSILDQFGKKYKFNTKLLTKKFAGQLFNKVVIAFPNANEKSIKIWTKRALDSLHGSGKGKEDKTQGDKS